MALNLGGGESDYKKRIAALLAQGAMDTSPIQSPWQGASRMAQALLLGLEGRDQDAKDKEFSAALGNLPGLSPGASTPAAPMAPAMSATPNTQPGKIYSNDEPSPLDPPSGDDRTRMIATILGESANQPAEDQNAVASVIRSRAVNGGYGGDTPSGVVTAKNQFEPWNTEGGRARMARAMANPGQAAAADQAIAMAYGEGGQAPNDPTGGALNFIQPKLQTALGRPMPDWAQKPGVMIGDHKFIGGANAPQQVASADPNFVPSALAAPAPQAAQPAPQQMAQAGQPVIPPQVAAQIRQHLGSSNPQIRALGMQLYQQYAAPQQYGFQSQPDGTILRTNPRTGAVEPVYQGATKPQFGVISEDEFGKKTYGFIDPAKGTAVPLPQQGGSASTPATVTGPDGKQIPIPAGVDPKKFRQDVTSATADAATGKKTEVQAKAEQFGNRMEAAEAAIAGGLEKEGLGVSGAAQQIAGGVPVVGSAMQSSNYQKFGQAKSQFITALLRQESGAAIGKEEFTRYDKEFFPQPGDAPEVVAQKAQSRQVAIAAMKKGAGPGYKSPDTAKQPVTKSIGGKEYYQENGQWFEK